MDFAFEKARRALAGIAKIKWKRKKKSWSREMIWLALSLIFLAGAVVIAGIMLSAARSPEKRDDYDR